MGKFKDGQIVWRFYTRTELLGEVDIVELELAPREYRSYHTHGGLFASKEEAIESLLTHLKNGGAHDENSELFNCL